MSLRAEIIKNDFRHIQPRGRGRVQLEIRCMSCGATEHVSCSGGMSSVTQETAERAFIRRGWWIGKNRKHDQCPDCLHARRKVEERAPLPALTNVVPINAAKEAPMPAQITKAEPPREMSRDDRRLIFSKLDEVYVDESRGYDAGWSDKRVADDLGVPRAWVEKIRDENFGPERSNEETRQTVAEAKRLRDEAVAALEKMQDGAREWGTIIARQMKEVDAFTARLEKIEKLYR